MKKTLFLTAMLVAVVAAPTMAATNVTLTDASETASYAFTGTDNHLWFNFSADADKTISTASSVSLGTTDADGSLWIGPNPRLTDNATINMSGDLSGQGTIDLNAFSDDTYKTLINMSGNASAFNGTLKLSDGNGSGTVQLNITGNASTYSGAVINAKNNDGHFILNISGATTLGGLQGGRVTSTNNNNTLTLNVGTNASTGATIGAVSGNGYYTSAAETAKTASASLNLVKQGTATQTLSGVVALNKVDVQNGTLSLTGSGAKNISGKLTVSGTGTLNIGSGTALSLSGTGHEIATTNLTFNGNSVVDTNGTEEVVNNGAFKALFAGGLQAVNEGTVKLTGNIAIVDTSINGKTETVEAGFNRLEITGNMSVNTYSHTARVAGVTTWKLNDDHLTVDGNLWLKNYQYMTVDGSSSALTVGGQLQLAHSGNNADGQYKGGLTVSNGGSATLNEIYFYGGGNTVTLGGQVTFTKADGNVLTGNNTDNAVNTVTFNGATLKAEENSWTMEAGASGATVTMSGENTLVIGADKTITIGGATIAAGTTLAPGTDNAGTLVIDGSTTLQGTLTANAKVQFNGTVTYTGAATSTDVQEKAGAANGFGTTVTTTTYQVLASGSTGTVTNNATWKLGEQTLELNNGALQTEAEVASTVYHVVTEANLSDISGQSSIKVENGGTLTITGSHNDIGTSIDNSAGGTLRLSGVSGYFKSNDTTIGNIELSGSEALTLDNGYSYHRGYTTHLGSISGEGTITTSGGNAPKERIEVSGDVANTVSFTGNRTNTGSSVTFAFTKDGVDNVTLADVTNSTATLNFEANALTVNSLTLNSGTVGVYAIGTQSSSDGSHSATDEVSLTTTTLTVNGNANLNANLVIADGGTLDFSSGAILTMGCDVTIEGNEVTVVIDSSELASIQQGNELTLITDIEHLNLSEAITVHFKGQNNQSLDGYGLRLEQGKDRMSLVVTPEPATATLSLLALAGLCARRRRH